MSRNSRAPRRDLGECLPVCLPASHNDSLLTHAVPIHTPLALLRKLRGVSDGTVAPSRLLGDGDAILDKVGRLVLDTQAY